MYAKFHIHKKNYIRAHVQVRNRVGLIETPETVWKNFTKFYKILQIDEQLIITIQSIVIQTSQYKVGVQPNVYHQPFMCEEFL